MQEFLDDLSSLNIDLTVYEKNKYIMFAMIGLKPANEEEEREAILTALDNNRNIEVSKENVLDYGIGLYF